MKILLPMTPHISSECLEVLLGKKMTNNWPEINTLQIDGQKVSVAVQINGKTREIIQIEKGTTEEKVDILSKAQSKIKNNLAGKKIVRTIFVKDRIINYLIK